MRALLAHSWPVVDSLVHLPQRWNDRDLPPGLRFRAPRYHLAGCRYLPCGAHSEALHRLELTRCHDRAIEAHLGLGLLGLVRRPHLQSRVVTQGFRNTKGRRVIRRAANDITRSLLLGELFAADLTAGGGAAFRGDAGISRRIFGPGESGPNCLAVHLLLPLHFGHQERFEFMHFPAFGPNSEILALFEVFQRHHEQLGGLGDALDRRSISAKRVEDIILTDEVVDGKDGHRHVYWSLLGDGHLG